jgi:hypothetical protein
MQGKFRPREKSVGKLGRPRAAAPGAGRKPLILQAFEDVA